MTTKVMISCADSSHKGVRVVAYTPGVEGTRLLGDIPPDGTVKEFYVHSNQALKITELDTVLTDLR